jgi:DNA-binding transcriptional ArsR family regulator
MSDFEEETYSTIFVALKHPIRRKILRFLSDGPRSFTEIQKLFKIDSPYLTYHLESLKNLVSKTDDGRYQLSSMGEGAVAAMQKVEETPEAPMRVRAGEAVKKVRIGFVISLCAGILMLVVSLVRLSRMVMARLVSTSPPAVFDLIIGALWVIPPVLVIWGATLITKPGKEITGANIVLINSFINSLFSMYTGGGWLFGTLGVLGGFWVLMKKSLFDRSIPQYGDRLVKRVRVTRGDAVRIVSLNIGTVLMIMGIVLLLSPNLFQVSRGFGGNMSFQSMMVEPVFSYAVTPQHRMHMTATANGTLTVYVLEVSEQALRDWIYVHQPKLDKGYFYNVTRLEAFLEANPNSIGWQGEIGEEKIEQKYIPTEVADVTLVFSNPTSDTIRVHYEGSVINFTVGVPTWILAQFSILPGFILIVPWFTNWWKDKKERAK